MLQGQLLVDQRECQRTEGSRETGERPGDVLDKQGHEGERRGEDEAQGLSAAGEQPCRR